MPPPVFLVGPTGSGKTSVALALVPYLNAEIISGDSMQVYRGMDIGTAKPTKNEQLQVSHHLIDIVDLSCQYNAARFASDAGCIIADIQNRNKLPLVVGGTGLYIKALIDGLFSGPGAVPRIRMELEKQAEQEGLPVLYNELISLDPASALRIQAQDKRRIIRALEVFRVTGRTITELQTQWKESKPAVIIGLRREREDLYNRINCRVEVMFQKGLVDEVKCLLDKGLAGNKTAAKALGYQETMNYLAGKYGLDRTKELIKQHTRQLAKRQLTWFNKDDRVKWIFISKDESEDAVVSRIRDILRGKIN